MEKFCHMATSKSSSKKNTEKVNKYWLSNIEIVLTHMVLELDVFGIAEKLLVPYVISYPKKFKKI